MADQTVKITNLPDSGSPARVAFDLMERIAAADHFHRGNRPPENGREYFIDLYKACRDAVY